MLKLESTCSFCTFLFRGLLCVVSLSGGEWGAKAIAVALNGYFLSTTCFSIAGFISLAIQISGPVVFLRIFESIL